jgi:tetratricopeptide (TPR) repeat protein
VTGYEVLGELGRGGMGVVYKAWQVRLERLVALKMILSGGHAGGEDLARFRTEAEAVARLQHPNVVQIYEVGEQDGLPFLALEFVDGGSLEKKLGGTPLPPPEAARLLETLARAVEAAHQRGVVHRDLKPANVLLTADGTPKITDFGLAKKLDQGSGQTQSGAIMGTPSYMAPEQAQGKAHAVGPAADVYALGAILYEMLTGRPPFKAANPLDTVLQVIAEEPVPPTRLQPRVPRDLETICLKCLQKEPGRRYASALALADDVGRFVRGEPITARPVRAWERAVKWARRRPAVAALAGVSGAALLALAAVIVVSNFRLQDERDYALDQKRIAEEQRTAANLARREAEDNFRKALDAVDEMLTQVGEEWLVNVPLMDTVRRALLEKALVYYQGFLKKKGDDPTVRAEVARAYNRVAEINVHLGRYGPAEQAFGRAIAMARELADEFPGEPRHRLALAQNINGLGHLLRTLGRTRQAEEAHTRALALAERLAADFPRDPDCRREAAGTLDDLGHLLRAGGQLARAEELYRKSLGRREQLAADFPDLPPLRHSLAQSCHNLAVVLDHLGRSREAETLTRRAAKLHAELVEKLPDESEYRRGLVKHYNSLGLLLRQAGRVGEAEEFFRKAVEGKARLTADFPNVPDYRLELANSQNGLGILLLDVGRAEEAGRILGEAVGVLDKLVADLPTVPAYRHQLAMTLHNLGTVGEATGQLKEAETARRRAVELHEKLAAEFPGVPTYRENLAKHYVGLGVVLHGARRLEEAEKAYRRGIALAEKLVAESPTVPDFRQILASLNNQLGMLLTDAGRVPEAVRAFRQALPLQETLAEAAPQAPDYQSELGAVLNNLAQALMRRGDFPESRRLLEQAVRHQSNALKSNPQHAVYRQYLYNHYWNLAEVLLRQGEHGAAAGAAAESAGVFPDRGGSLYDAACYLARCVPLAEKDARLPEEKRRELAGQYAERSGKLLREAVRNGFKDIEHLKKDTDLDPLRSRPGFPDLLKELERQAQAAVK